MSRLELCAEISANHLGSLDRALAIVDAAADAGADLLKVQTWTPGTMCVSKDYALGHGPWAGRKLFDLYEEAFTPWEWHAPIFERARARGMEPFGAAFDMGAVDFLCSLGVNRLKVASFELVDLPLIRYMASKGKPVILSTGMATTQEVYAAIQAAAVDAPLITILTCTSAYPASPHDANLARGPAMREDQWGLSDHTMGIGVACAAAAMGAKMIEKHLTLSRADGGPDAGFSMEPHEFKQMVVECRRAAVAVGTVKYGPGPNESTELRRSMWVTKDAEPGELLCLGLNVATARPALGMSPALYRPNMRAAHAIKAGQPLTSECVQ